LRGPAGFAVVALSVGHPQNIASPTGDGLLVGYSMDNERKMTNSHRNSTAHGAYLDWA